MIDRDVKKFVLQALLAANDSPMLDESLKRAVRGGFERVAFTESELDEWLLEMKDTSLIESSTDDVFGKLWGLTQKGKIKAKQIPR